MDHLLPKTTGFPPDDVPQSDNTKDFPYQNQGEVPYPQNHNQPYPSQPFNQVGSSVRDDDMKEYIPSSHSTTAPNQAPANHYPGYPSPEEVAPLPPYTSGVRDHSEELYLPNNNQNSNPNNNQAGNPAEHFSPMREEKNPAPMVDPNTGGYYTTPTPSNLVQGQPPLSPPPISTYNAPPHPVQDPAYNNPNSVAYPPQPPHPSSHIGQYSPPMPQTLRENNGNNTKNAVPEEQMPFSNHSYNPNLGEIPVPMPPMPSSYPPDSGMLGYPPNQPSHNVPYYAENVQTSAGGSQDFVLPKTGFDTPLPPDSSGYGMQQGDNSHFETPYIQEATPDTVLNLWKRVLEILKTKLPPACMDEWFYKESDHDGSVTVQPVLPVSFQGDTFTLMASNPFVKEMFEQSFSANVSEVLEALVNNRIKVEVRLNDSAHLVEEVTQVNYNVDYTFENFIVSKENETAYQFAKIIAETETAEMNPFFIYGQSGLGKTHLVCAIANAKKAQMEEKRKQDFQRNGSVRKNIKIIYATGGEWIDEWIEAIRLKTTNSFRDKYADCDLFILDDVQFLAPTKNTQDELFNLLDKMIRLKRQVVFTSDCHPNKLNEFHARLTTRFSQGLTQEVLFPDYETCIAITRSKAEQKGLNLPDPLIELIAENTKSSVREIEGWVNKIFAKCDMSNNRELDEKTVMSLVKEIVVDNKESGPTPKDFIRSVANYYNVSEEDLIAHGRTKQIVLPRNIAIYIIRENTNLSLKEIGDLFSGRDHSTIKNSLNNVSTILKKEDHSGNDKTKTDIADIIQRAQTSPVE